MDGMDLRIGFRGQFLCVDKGKKTVEIGAGSHKIFHFLLPLLVS